MRKRSTALVLTLICAFALAGNAYPKPQPKLTRKKQTTNLKKQATDLYPVFKRDETTGEKRFGLIDKTGRLVIGFDRLPKETFGVGVVHDGRGRFITRTKTSSGVPIERTGYIDERGVVVIPATFLYGHSFGEGLALVAGDGWRGYIDRSGQIVIKTGDDEEGGDFHEGLAAVGGNKHWGYIDHSGRTVIEREYESAGDFSEGLAPVVVNRKFGFIDKRGEMRIPPRFEPLRGRHLEILGGTSFSEGVAPVSTDLVAGRPGRYGYINRKGDFVIQPQFQTAGAFSEGLAFVVIREGFADVNKAGWIDKSGAWVLTALNNCVSDLVKQDTYGYWDWRYREGLINFCDYSGRDQLWGYMDRNGKVVIEPRYNNALPFAGGIARVFNGPKMISPTYLYTDDYGYIDRTGKFIWSSIPSKPRK
jgi:hypothetical protein